MASAEEFATLVKHVHDQDAIINLLRHNVDEAGRRIQQLEAEKKKNPYGHIHFGKELCPEPFDGKTSEGFKAWKVKAEAMMTTRWWRNCSSGPASRRR